MEKKVVSLKCVKYEKMYREYFKDYRNQEFAKSCFFKADTVIKVKIS
jgi:hypothetical protein